MDKKENNKEFIIDAEGKTIGRLATRIAILLRGKNSADFEKHIAGTNIVKVINASKIKFHADKINTRYHKHYTGYPGGMRTETLKQTTDKKGYGELIRKAVFGMIPGNKLRPIIIKNLTITE